MCVANTPGVGPAVTETRRGGATPAANASGSRLPAALQAVLDPLDRLSMSLEGFMHRLPQSGKPCYFLPHSCLPLCSGFTSSGLLPALGMEHQHLAHDTDVGRLWIRGLWGWPGSL
jgi:hypothetical protein